MTDVRTSSAGQNVSSLAIVSADQVTILGDGTAENPLRASGSGGNGSGDFIADLVLPFDYHLGNAMIFDSGSVEPALASGGPGAGLLQAAVCGLIVEFLDSPSVRVRFRGLVELTTEQWDVVTTQSGGLTVSSIYYLSDDDFEDSGHLSTSPGGNVAQIGVALSSTIMLVGLPAAPAVGA